MSITLDMFVYVHQSRDMDITYATTLFGALSQETRLRAFRLLVQAGPDGLAAGVLSDELDTPHNTMSFHLHQLATTGLISSRREGRSIIYSANFELVRDLIGFMVKDCCTASFASIREDSKTGCAVIELGELCGTDLPDRP